MTLRLLLHCYINCSHLHRWTPDRVLSPGTFGIYELSSSCLPGSGLIVIFRLYLYFLMFKNVIYYNLILTVIDFIAGALEQKLFATSVFLDVPQAFD